VVLSSGSRYVAVPDLRGLTIDKAKTVLGSLNLDLDDNVQREPDAELVEGLIVRSTPTAKSRVDRQSRVRVVVSSGVKPAPLPDGPTAGANAVPEGTGENPAAPTRKASMFTLHVRLSSLSKPTRVKIEMTDDEGTKQIDDEIREPGDTFDISSVGYGEKAVFKFYYDGRLVETLAKNASGENVPQ
jgi:serine/threonine-protein kinase